MISMRDHLLYLIVAALLSGCESRAVVQHDGGFPGDWQGPDGLLKLDTGPLPDLRPTCAPGDPPLLDVRLARQGSSYVGRVKNVGCGQAARLVGCCGEGDPVVQQLDAAGSWGPSGCPPVPMPCCNALPHCQLLARGDMLELAVYLDPTQCPTGLYRVAVHYGTHCGEPPWNTETPLSAFSNPVQIGN